MLGFSCTSKSGLGFDLGLGSGFETINYSAISRSYGKVLVLDLRF